MSSSLLIILLVIVWLFVLAPMVIRGRNPIRRTGDALAETRTLHAGGSGRLIPKRGRTYTDREMLELDATSLFGLPSGEGSTDSELLDAEDWELTIEQTLRHEAAGRRGAAVRRAIDERREREEQGADGEQQVAAEQSTPTTEVTDEIPIVPPEMGDRDRTFVVDGEVVDRGRGEQHEMEETPPSAAEIDEEQLLTHRGRVARREAVELTEADIDFAERRRGRGAYDPMADRRAAEVRAVRRQRTTLGLTLVSLIAVAVALLTSNAFWYVAGVSAVLLVAYLTYIRRQTKLEHSLRQRRIERMRRARLGVESREDDELSVVPPRLQRPGATVLEVDDEDPEFDALETYRHERPVEDAPRRRTVAQNDYATAQHVPRKVG